MEIVFEHPTKYVFLWSAIDLKSWRAVFFALLENMAVRGVLIGQKPRVVLNRAVA